MLLLVSYSPRPQPPQMTKRPVGCCLELLLHFWKVSLWELVTQASQNGLYQTVPKKICFCLLYCFYCTLQRISNNVPLLASEPWSQVDLRSEIFYFYSEFGQRRRSAEVFCFSSTLSSAALMNYSWAHVRRDPSITCSPESDPSHLVIFVFTRRPSTLYFIKPLMRNVVMLELLCISEGEDICW